MKSLNELFVETLRDIYYVEKQLTKALPKMAKKATSEDLAKAFTTHLSETEGQIERLDQVFRLLDKPARGKKCAAIEGLIEEATEIMSEAESDVVRDAGMLAAAQAVEHYEISRYGTLKAWAEKLQLEEVAELLDETLQEEKATDQKLTELAESEINIEAEEAGDDEEVEEDEKRPKAKIKAKA
jgi:ferritin-like metal-binding protein YciE